MTPKRFVFAFLYSIVIILLLDPFSINRLPFKQSDFESSLPFRSVASKAVPQNTL
jgi:hypothetical protein